MQDLEKTAESTIFKMQGNLVASKAKSLRAELLELVKGDVKQLVIDIEDVEMIDSSGLGVLISAQNTLKEKGGGLKVINASESILKMLQVMRLDRHFEVAGHT